tara:strand:- start:288 stop:1652 length:1365 start_codon:yes stop_codon:yes gene_type:complete
MSNKEINLTFNQYDKTKKSICFIASSGMSLRNILLESSLKSILKLQNRYNIFFITEKKYVESYDFQLNFIQINRINNKTILKISRVLNIFSRFLFDKLNYTDTKSIQYKYDWLGNSYTRLFYKFRKVIPNSNFLLYLIRKINNYLIRLFSPEIKRLIKNLNPEHVISLDPLNKIEYSYLLHSSFHCNTSAVIKSFDNITSKGYIPFVPDNIFVWNNLMVSEAIEAYGFFKPKIFAIGAPQYDHVKSIINYIKSESNQILYCTNSSDIYNDDKKNIDYILTFLDKYNFKLLIRVKQTDKFQRWDLYSNSKNVEIYPDNIIQNDANRTCSNINHQISLEKQIRDSFVVISSYSTIVYDSLALKTPSINLGYTYTRNKNDWSIIKCEGFNHIKPLIKPLCVDNVRSKEQLKEKILYRYKNGFNNKEEDERRKFIKKFLGANLKDTAVNNLIASLNLL